MEMNLKITHKVDTECIPKTSYGLLKADSDEHAICTGKLKIRNISSFTWQNLKLTMGNVSPNWIKQLPVSAPGGSISISYVLNRLQVTTRIFTR